MRMQMLPFLISIISMCLFLNTTCASTAFCANALAISHVSTKPNAQMQLKTSIVEKKYCSDDDLRLVLRLTFTNMGRQSLVLYKNSSVIGRYKVSQPHGEGYEMDVSPMKTLFTSGLRSDTPDESLFVTLLPRRSYSLDVEFHLAISDGTKATKQFLRAGDHLLRIAVWTWYYSPASAKEFRTKWRKKGILWSETVNSLPMAFSVDSQPKLSVCSTSISRQQ